MSHALPPPNPGAHFEFLAPLIALLALVFGLLLFGVGCGQPIPVKVTDWRDGGGKLSAAVPAELEEACAVIGIVCEATAREYGSITIDIVGDGGVKGGDVDGMTHDAPCRPNVVARSRASILAHELGHVFGADLVVGADDEGHLDLPRNLMLKTPVFDALDIEILSSQRREIEIGTDLFVGCR